MVFSDYWLLLGPIALALVLWKTKLKEPEREEPRISLKCVACGVWSSHDGDTGGMPRVEFVLNTGPAKADYVLLRLQKFYCAPDYKFTPGAHPTLPVEGVTCCGDCGTYSLWNYSIAPVALHVGTVN